MVNVHRGTGYYSIRRFVALLKGCCDRIWGTTVMLRADHVLPVRNLVISGIGTCGRTIFDSHTNRYSGAMGRNFTA